MRNLICLLFLVASLFVCSRALADAAPIPSCGCTTAEQSNHKLGALAGSIACLGVAIVSFRRLRM